MTSLLSVNGKPHYMKSWVDCRKWLAFLAQMSYNQGNLMQTSAVLETLTPVLTTRKATSKMAKIDSTSKQLPLPIDGAIVEIPLTKGHVAIVDAIDVDLLRYTWTAQETISGHVYAFRYDYSNGNKNRKRVYLHREVYQRKAHIELSKSNLIDHWNNNGLDNTRGNLRLTDYSGNRANARRKQTSTSIYKGVSLDKKAHKWQANIKVNGQRIYLGLYESPQEAYTAYCEAAKKYFGEFARFE